MIGSLKTRLVLQIGLMALAVALAGAAGVWGVNGLHQDFGTAREGYQQLRRAYEIGADVAVARAALSAEQPDQRLAQQALRRASGRTALEAAGGQDPDAWSRIDTALSAVVAALSSGGEGLARANESISRVMSELGRLSTEARLRIDHSAQAATDRRRQTLVAVATLGALALVTVTAVGWLQYRSVVVPLNRVAAGVHRLAQRDFAGRIEPVGDREFRDLTRDFNAMADELQSLYSELERRVALKSQELARSARLASVGYLAAGVAHEINNPLSLIAGYGERSLRQLDRGDVTIDSEPVRQALRIVCEEAFRCREITNRLLSLARPDSAPRRVLRLSEIVREVAAALGGLPAFKRSTLMLEISDAEPSVLADAGEMKQVVLNLMINALEAVRQRGEEARIAVSIAPADGCVRLVVADNGIGMSEEVLHQVFEPFYTRRPATSGTGAGLGLAITHAIVTEHGGRISAESDGPDRGARFVVELPVARQEVAR